MWGTPPQRQTLRRATNNLWRTGVHAHLFSKNNFNKLMEAQAGTGSNSGFPAFDFDGSELVRRQSAFPFLGHHYAERNEESLSDGKRKQA
jgi:hypothetical protein